MLRQGGDAYARRRAWDRENKRHNQQQPDKEALFHERFTTIHLAGRRGEFADFL
jgi:hypothetical protein